ncbi:MAG TPA: helix-turn-helix domain-containing protein [Steroidobacteraceae bacterium]|nr:helix-turn-helix domain-containing protein [Steroidobacteraceae bacterium]
MIRTPHPALRPFVRDLWINERPRSGHPNTADERAMPDGLMHIVIRLSHAQIRIADSSKAHDFGYAVLGGARSGHYVRGSHASARSIGATLLPGAARVFFGNSALAFANRHTKLDDLWGAEVTLLREHLAELRRPSLQLDLFELYLLNRLPAIRGVHPAIAASLAALQPDEDVSSMVERSGFSHRRFVELFVETVGLSPKKFMRVRRFQRVLKMLSAQPTKSWAQLALDAGYADQPHLNRDFREFAGLAPEEYRRAAPESPGHVVIADPPRSK